MAQIGEKKTDLSSKDQCKVDLIANETSWLFFAHRIRSLAISQFFPIRAVGGQWGVDIIWPHKREDSWQGPVFRWGKNKFLDERHQSSSSWVLVVVSTHHPRCVLFGLPSPAQFIPKKHRLPPQKRSSEFHRFSESSQHKRAHGFFCFRKGFTVRLV